MLYPAELHARVGGSLSVSKRCRGAAPGVTFPWSAWSGPAHPLCTVVNLGLFVGGLYVYTVRRGAHDMLSLIILGAVALVVVGVMVLVPRLSPPPPTNRSEVIDRMRRLQ